MLPKQQKQVESISMCIKCDLLETFENGWLHKLEEAYIP